MKDIETKPALDNTDQTGGYSFFFYGKGPERGTDRKLNFLIKCKRQGKSMAQVLNEFIEEYLTGK